MGEHKSIFMNGREYYHCIPLNMKLHPPSTHSTIEHYHIVSISHKKLPPKVLEPNGGH
jgi:hypothetical protein